MPPRHVERGNNDGLSARRRPRWAVPLFASVETSQIARDPDSDAAQFAFSRPNAIVNIAQLSNESNLAGGRRKRLAAAAQRGQYTTRPRI